MKNNFFKLSDQTIQYLIQMIKNLIIYTKSQTRTKIRSVLCTKIIIIFIYKITMQQ